MSIFRSWNLSIQMEITFFYKKKLEQYVTETLFEAYENKRRQASVYIYFGYRNECHIVIFIYCIGRDERINKTEKIKSTKMQADPKMVHIFAGDFTTCLLRHMNAIYVFFLYWVFLSFFSCIVIYP